MSLATELAALAIEADEILAEIVEIDGVEVLAIVQDVPLVSDIQESGTDESSVISVVVRKAALEDVPTHGVFVIHEGKTYAVKNVTTDTVWYTLFCFLP